MAELRVKGTGTIKLFENDNTSSVTIASPASLGGDRTVTLPDGDVTLATGTMPVLTGSTNNEIVTVTGANAMQGESTLTYDGTNLDLGDNKLVRFGTGNDATISHSGSDFLLENSTGNLVIQDTDGDIYLRAKSGENSISCNNDGEVTLYYDNAAKLDTTATGVNVTGSVAIDGNELFEEITTSIVASGNKTVDTNYDSTVDVTAGKWLPLVNLQVSAFENHANANSTGIYLCYLLLGTSAGDSSYGEMSKTMMKWGNASNSYGDQTGGHFPIITLGSTTTIHCRWYVSEYGDSSNFWVRGNVSKLTFIRVG